ncbi:hypothetical protein BHE74_00050621 [Ensete ventricosum]|nr:hypothetical protein GW17_00037063 [Ensete ventricosum]RWW43693.1 hypothetical protein BHE74_00050621 [Ensete ventricosum]
MIAMSYVPVLLLPILWRSYIPVFHIRMEKMKKVKRSPLQRYPHDGSLQRNSSNLISQLCSEGGRRIGGGD